MAERKPNRKKKAIRHKPVRYDPLNRAVSKRSVRRWVRRKRKNHNRKKDILNVLLGFTIALAIIITLYHLLTLMEAKAHH